MDEAYRYGEQRRHTCGVCVGVLDPGVVEGTVTLVDWNFSVFGVAEPVPESWLHDHKLRTKTHRLTRVWLHPGMPQREGLEVPDAWLLLEGIEFTGTCVVGLVLTGESTGYEPPKAPKRFRYGRISYDPDPVPPGRWRGDSTKGGKARWVPVKPKTAWELVLGA